MPFIEELRFKKQKKLGTLQRIIFTYTSILHVRRMCVGSRELSSSKHRLKKLMASIDPTCLQTNGCPRTEEESAALHAQMACNRAKVKHKEALAENNAVAAQAIEVTGASVNKTTGAKVTITTTFRGVKRQRTGCCSGEIGQAGDTRRQD